MERYATYRPATWNKLIPYLSGLSADELKALAARLQIKVDEGDSPLEELLIQGHALLILLGLVRDPAIMTGTVFEYGGLEYIINPAAAEVLRRGTGSARIDIVGGGREHTFSYGELIRAMLNSDSFDQLDRQWK